MCSSDLDLTAPNLSPVMDGPVRNIVPNLVYAASGHEVRDVLVAGRLVVRAGRVLTADEAAIQAEAQAQAGALARRVAAEPVHREMALIGAMAARQL